jgi:hypothetical protein
MEIIITTNGQGRCVYDEAIDLTALGHVTIQRASHVEPDDEGRWQADLSPVDGPVLGPFERRSSALDAEQRWLRHHWLLKCNPQV